MNGYSSESIGEYAELLDAPHSPVGAAIPVPSQNKTALPPIQSPSLDQRCYKFDHAHEMKFLLSEQQAVAVEAALRKHITVDPYSLDAGYLLTTLYLDTPQLDALNARGRHRLFKLRLRRYGESDVVYLERKAKQGLRVRKRRSMIGVQDLPRLLSPMQPVEWTGDWYRSQIVRGNLRPACLLHYHRVAYFGSSDSGPIRLTFDRHVSGALVEAWSLAHPARMIPLLPDRVVCEFKYRGPLPHLFKEIIGSQLLMPTKLSKYRHCWQAVGGGAAHA